MTTTMNDVHHLLHAIDVSQADEQELTTTANNLHRCQRFIDRALNAIALRSDELFQHGESGSPEEILGASGDISNNTARKQAERAKTTKRLPQLGEAFNDGTIGSDHLDSATRHTKGLTDEQLNHLDQNALANAAKTQNPDTFNRTAKTLADKAKNDWGLGQAIEDRKKSELKWWRNRHTGMGHFSGCLDPERYDAFQALIDAEMNALARDRKADTKGPNGAQRPGTTSVKLDAHLAIDALISLLERGSTNQSGATRPVINLHADYDTATNGPHNNSVSETSDGSHLAPEQLQRLLCDSVIQAIIFDKDGNVLNAGRRHRTATEKQWAVIRSLHRTCAWHQCQRPINHCQAHHVDYWENGGLTDIDNLVPLCSHHHHRVHDMKWELKLLPDRTLKIYQPDGTHWATAEPDRPTGTRGDPPNRQ